MPKPFPQHKKDYTPKIKKRLQKFIKKAESVF